VQSWPFRTLIPRSKVPAVPPKLKGDAASISPPSWSPSPLCPLGPALAASGLEPASVMVKHYSSASTLNNCARPSFHPPRMLLFDPFSDELPLSPRSSTLPVHRPFPFFAQASRPGSSPFSCSFSSPLMAEEWLYGNRDLVALHCPTQSRRRHFSCLPQFVVRRRGLL